MASRGRSLPALTKAWIAVSTSIGVLRLWAEASWDWSWCARQMLTCGAAVQRWLCRSSRQSVPCGLPIPGQQLVKPVDRRAPRDHPLEHIRQIGLWVEVVQLRRVEQTGEDCPGPGPALAAGEERILPAKCNLLVILPISGRTSWSIIAGIPSSGLALASAAASSVSP